MGPDELRLKCLELAANLIPYEDGGTAQNQGDIALDIAKKWSAFVIGDPVRESKSHGQRGADDPVKK